MIGIEEGSNIFINTFNSRSSVAVLKNDGNSIIFELHSYENYLMFK